MTNGNKGWKNEPMRHGLAAKGIKTGNLVKNLKPVVSKKLNEYGEPIVSISAAKEAESYIDKAKEAMVDYERSLEKAKSVSDSFVRDAIMKEANRYYNKAARYEKKADEIENIGLSKAEQRKLIQEAKADFTVVRRGRDIGSTDTYYVGKSDSQGVFVLIKHVKYSSYLSNVRGMGSLAGKEELRWAREISPEEAEMLASGERTSTTSFMGMTETKSLGK